MDPLTKSLIKWMGQGQRYHSDAMSKFGHAYEDAVHDGLIVLGEQEVFMRGRYRDIRRPIYLAGTPAQPAAPSPPA